MAYGSPPKGTGCPQEVEEAASVKEELIFWAEPLRGSRFSVGRHEGQREEVYT